MKRLAILLLAGCGDDASSPDASEVARVVSIEPSPGTAIGHGDTVRVTFDRAVDLSPGSHTPQIYCCDGLYGTSGSYSCAPSAVGDTLVIRAALEPASTSCMFQLREYAVTVSTSAMAWSYQAVDKLPPTASQVASGYQPLDAPIQVELSEPVTGVSDTSVTMEAGGSPIAGAVTMSGTTVTFTPANPLAPDTTYTVTLGTAIVDLAGNALTTTYAPGSFDIPPPTPNVFTVVTAP